MKTSKEIILEIKLKRHTKIEKSENSIMYGC